jgi:hypothetical protein
MHKKDKKRLARIVKLRRINLNRYITVYAMRYKANKTEPNGGRGL